MVATVLKNKGFAVDTAVDGREAFELAIRYRPDLLITDILMPNMDGFRLVSQLRSRPELSLLPILLLSALNDHEDRIRGFRLGVDDHLAKPFRFEELELRVAKTLRHRENHLNLANNQFCQSLPAATGLTGDLSQIGLSSLLTLLDIDRQSGVLSLNNSHSNESIQIYLNQGRIVRATLDGNSKVTNAECIYYAMRWLAGPFNFCKKKITFVDEIGQTTPHLLIEAARLIDESTS